MRSQSTVLLLISFFFVKFAQSQSNELLVQGETGNLHLVHTVIAKENWYSVGRLYNLSPKDLTAYNKLALTQPLVIGQTLQIPLTMVNFSQNGQKLAGETLVPVYHVIQEKEWMYRISVNHNKVPIPSLEKWNNVNKDQIHPGMHLIVGYLKVKTALSALATGGGSGAVAAAPAGKGGTSAAGNGVTSAVSGGAPAVAKGATTAPEKTAVAKGNDGEGSEKTGEKAASEKAVEKAGYEKSSEKPAVAKANDGAVTEKPVVSEPVEKPAAEKPIVEKPAVKKPENEGTAAAPKFNGGAFRGEFNESGKSASGQAGTFKSTSGWQDGKYYALMNSAPVGTIVRVSDASTGKVIFAKVLGQLPDMKESAGLTIRISNAAAGELGESEGRFNVSVRY